MLRQATSRNRALLNLISRQCSQRHLFCGGSRHTHRPGSSVQQHLFPQSEVVSRRIAVGAAAAGAAPTAAAAPAPAPAAEAPAIPLSFADRPGLCDGQGRLQLKNLTLEELHEWVESIGHDGKRALQLWRAMYGDNRWLRGLDDASSAAESAPLAAAFRAAVAQAASLEASLSLQSVTTARDGTHKLVFALHGGEGGAVSGNVETVLIPMRNRDGTQLRYTACLSSQVGCAMNCQFCYTGRMGLLANLTTAQMVEQLVEARRWLAAYTQQQQQQQQQQGTEQQQQQQQPSIEQHAAAADDVPSSYSSSSSSSRRGRSKAAWPLPPPRINNIVFMGMGEPLHNMSALMPALDIICHPQGLALSRSKVIVSTVGLVPQIRQLRASNKAKLAVSLHATTNEVRSWIVPANRKHPLEELIGTLRELYPLPAPRSTAQPASTTTSTTTTSSSSSTVRSDDFVVIEYVLLRGVNDTEEDAQRLLQLLGDVYCMINLIVFNPHEGTRFQRSDESTVKRFRQLLMEGGKVCTLRMSKGDDEMAACGQLGNPQLSSRPAPLLKPPRKLQEALPGAAAAAEQQAALLQQQMLEQQQASMAAM